MLGKVDLPPTPGAARFSDPLARRRTDVLRHAFIIELAFALYLAHTLCRPKGRSNEPFLRCLVLACSAVCLAQTPQSRSDNAGLPETRTGPQAKAPVKDGFPDLFRNVRLKIKEDKLQPVAGNDKIRVAWGVWMPEVPGNDLISPEQVSISCNATESLVACCGSGLRVSPWGIELEKPDETDFNIISWDARGLLATYGPDQVVDKCHRSVLSMSFASGEVSLSDIPTHEKDCKVFVNTNTYRLQPGSYYVDTTPNNDGPKF